MVENKKTTWDRSKEFMAKHWYGVWIALVVSTTYSMYASMESKRLWQETVEMVREQSRGVVMLDMSGRPVYAEKQHIGATDGAFKTAIANIVSQYGVTDWSRLTNNFKVQKIGSLKQLESYNPQIVEFEKNYFSEERHPAGVRDVDHMKKTLLYMMSTDELPDIISVHGYQVSDYTIDGDHFTGVISYEVSAKVFIIESAKWEDRSGHIIFDVSGYFEPKFGSAINPLGIYFDVFKPTYMKKRG